MHQRTSMPTGGSGRMTLARRPRFTDIASVLPLLAQETGESQLELFQTYLDSLREITGSRLSSREALRELRLVRFANTCWTLPWLMRAVEGGAGFDLRGELALKARWLYDDLLALEGLGPARRC